MRYIIGRRLKRRFHKKLPHDPVTILRPDHKLSREKISPNALKVLYRLHQAEYSAYLVGGGVRDILVGRTPKDFDVVTDAHPEEVRKLFRNSRMIGRRFRIVHVYFSDEIIEVSTFRANLEERISKDGETELPEPLAQSENEYGTIEEDAWRRDFTVNSLYYNIADFSIVDYTGGSLDVRSRQLRMIGDPVQRYHEDPVRLLRAIRLSAKLKFSIERATESPLYELVHLLQHVPPSRLFDETLKLFFEGNAFLSYQALRDYGYLGLLFPDLSKSLKAKSDKTAIRLVELAMKATDYRFNKKMTLNPGFLFSVMLWPGIQQCLRQSDNEKELLYQSLHGAISESLGNQLRALSMPKRFTAMMRSIWMLQYHLLNRRRSRIMHVLSQRYFRAAYDFLELRVKSGESHGETLEWWTQIQNADGKTRGAMIEALPDLKRHRPNRRQRGR